MISICHAIFISLIRICKKIEITAKEEIEKFASAYNLDIHICYGEELFIKEHITEAWNDEIIDFKRVAKNCLICRN